jgi:hypothetical protein
MIAIIAGLGVYLFLCVFTLLSGLGFLSIWRLKTEKRFLLFLAPVITLSLWAIFLGIAISVGFPVKQIWMFLLSLTGIFAGIGLMKKNCRPKFSDWPMLGFIFLQPLGVMFFYFAYGIQMYLGSSLPDGWSYIAFGQYLWEFARGTEGGLAPLYQYAAHLSQTRFIASGLLGFFTIFTGSLGDTQASSGYFLSWTLFVFSSSCFFFALTQGLKSIYPYLYVSFCLFSGWIINLLWANNYDNALAISFLPAFAGLGNLIDRYKNNWVFIVGLLLAGTLYSYPETAPPIFLGAFIFCNKRFILRGNIRSGIYMIIVSTSFAMLISFPFLKNLFIFFIEQVRIALSSHSGLRPGEGMFNELLHVKYALPAIWGFAPVFTAGNVLHHLFAIFLTLASGLGIWVLITKKEWGLLFIFSLLLFGSLTMIVYFGYPYGVYKFQLLNWWLLSFTVIMGCSLLSTNLNSLKYRWGFLLIAGAIFVATGVRLFSLNRETMPHSILDFKMIENIQNIIHQNPVLVRVEDDLASEWAVYFLRNHSVYLAGYNSYMALPHVIPFMDRAKAIQTSEIKYLLTDEWGKGLFGAEKSPRLLWKGKIYHLYQIDSPWVVLTGLENPNGLEKWGARQGFWVSQEKTVIHLLANVECQVMFSADFCPGPSLPGKIERTVLIENGKSYHKVFTLQNDRKSFLLPLSAGGNQIFLRSLDQPTLPRLPNGDKRPLLVGVTGIQIEIAPSRSN